ncbi:hypothetical protein EVG20_g9335 [Dentipellis fragilis]|uniref:Uncharacterized protein n=1 Tax=Dentipellis fragilis TaxID=205917 RepID=A0A4Y9Y3K8_9AGAM|nr:hypothetical protein EVG20_g9335 [Dentipellis fragilis]
MLFNPVAIVLGVMAATISAAPVQLTNSSVTTYGSTVLNSTQAKDALEFTGARQALIDVTDLTKNSTANATVVASDPSQFANATVVAQNVTNSSTPLNGTGSCHGSKPPPPKLSFFSGFRRLFSNETADAESTTSSDNDAEPCPKLPVPHDDSYSGTIIGFRRRFRSERDA